jgi:nucleoside-diphosphate-sugar epimerase
MSTFHEAEILVVGGAGFVGSNLVRLLLEQRPRRIVVVDNLLSSERDNLPRSAQVSLLEETICAEGVLAEIPGRFDIVFHLACYHGNQSSIHDPIADHDNNLITTLKLMDRLKGDKRLRKLVYAAAGCASAVKTFSSAVATPEDAPVSFEQDSPYSISKLVGEFYSVYYSRQHGLPIVRARFQNVYGSGEVLGAGRWRGTPATVWRNVTPTFIWKALRGEALPLHNHGDASRDFIHVEDICRGLMACAENGAPGGVYNLATGGDHLIRDWASMINALTGNRAPPQLLGRREWDRSGKRFGDPTKAGLELGFKASIAAEEGLRRTVEWTRAHAARIERCIGRHDAEMARYQGGL